MTGDIVNVEQAANWDGPDGEYWVAHQARFDTLDPPPPPPAHGRGRPSPPGSGSSTSDAGTGSRAVMPPRHRARWSRLRRRPVGADAGPGRRWPRTRVWQHPFQQADAQAHPFEPGAFDVVLSRLGVMFFAIRWPPSPTSAWRSDRGPAGLLVWQPMGANEWMTAMRETSPSAANLPSRRRAPPARSAWPTPTSPLGADAAGFADIDFSPRSSRSNRPDAVDAYGFPPASTPSP